MVWYSRGMKQGQGSGVRRGFLRDLRERVNNLLDRGEGDFYAYDRPHLRSTPAEDANLVEQMNLETLEHLAKTPGVPSGLREMAIRRLHERR